jgi:hypothetical protein
VFRGNRLTRVFRPLRDSRFLVPPLLTIVSLAAKSRLSRSSTLGTHTRSIQAHVPAAQSSPPRPLGPCIADRKNRFSKGLAHGTQPLAMGFDAAAPCSDNPPGCAGFAVEEKRNLVGTISRRGPADIVVKTKITDSGPAQASVAERPVALPPVN